MGKPDENKQASDRHVAIESLRRLAMGKPNDAMLLMELADELTSRQKEALDLHGVSDIKRLSGGGYEIKLYDKMKAIQMLLEESKDEKPQLGQSLYSALGQGAKALAEDEREDKPDDEV